MKKPLSSFLGRLTPAVCAVALAECSLAQAGTIAPDAILLADTVATTIEGFQEGFAVVHRGNAHAVIDTTGRLVVPYHRYVSIGGFINGFAKVFRVEGSEWKGGFIDHSGREVLSAANRTLGQPDKRGYVCVEHEFMKFKLANLRTGHERILDDGTQGVTALVFSDGLCIHREKPLLRGEQNSSTPMRPYGFKDHHGHIRIPPSYSAVHAFSEGLAAVKVTNDFGESKWGFIDTNGRMAISPRFSNEPKDFHDGRAFVEPVDKTEYAFGFIDRTGEVVIKMRTHVAAPDKSFHDGYIFTSDHGDNRNTVRMDTLGQRLLIPNSGHINEAGSELQYYKTSLHDDGLFRIDRRSPSPIITQGRMDLNGKVLIPPIFHSIGLFDPVSGLATAHIVRADGTKTTGCIDRTGVFRIVQVATTKW